MTNPRGQPSSTYSFASAVLLIYLLGLCTSSCAAQDNLASSSVKYHGAADGTTSHGSGSLYTGVQDAWQQKQSLIPVPHVHRGPSAHSETQCPLDQRIGPQHYLSLHFNVTIDASSKTGIRGKLVDSTHAAHTAFPEPIMVRMNDPDPMLGWTRALLGLCSGDWVTMVVPPELAYGESGNGKNIPGGARLHMDLQIVTAHDDPEQHYKATRDAKQMFQQMDSDHDGKVTFDEMELFLDVPMDYPNRESFLRQHFHLSDYNKDGTVSLDEFIAILANWQGIDEL